MLKINLVKLIVKLAHVKIDLMKVEFNVTKVQVNLAKSIDRPQDEEMIRWDNESM